MNDSIDVYIDKAFRALPSYEFGQSHETLTIAEDAIKAATSSGEGTRAIAAQLARLLEFDSTNDCKQFVCRQLAVIGGPENVDAIAPLLLDAKTADMARYALEPMDNDEAGKALLDALDHAPPSAHAGIINSLGRRGSKRAIRTISRRVSDVDPIVASAAINALGNIGGRNAVQRLASSGRRVSREMRRPVEDALLNCAHGCLDEGENHRAAKIFGDLLRTASTVAYESPRSGA